MHIYIYIICVKYCIMYNGVYKFYHNINKKRIKSNILTEYIAEFVSLKTIKLLTITEKNWDYWSCVGSLSRFQHNLETKIKWEVSEYIAT